MGKGVEGSAAGRILLPLAGKTIDIPYLAEHDQVKEVVGVESVRKAVEEFASEQSHLDVRPVGESADGKNEVYEGRGSSNGALVRMIMGDFFACNEENCFGRFQCAFDRGGLVAVDPSVRSKYAEVLDRLMAPGGKVLLVCFDRRAGSEEAKRNGPPFSVPQEEVRSLFEPRGYRVDQLSSYDQVDEVFKPDGQPWRAFGLTSMLDEVYLLTKPPSS